MTMSEKLLKAFEALRGHYNQVSAASQQASSTGESSPVTQRKKDNLLLPKERISLCTIIADFLPFQQSIRENQVFPNLLSVSIELLFQACDDTDADVRLMAGEALNKIIKALLESNIGRVQVEFYKEIKKNGPARSLRAAIQRFAETCHMIRPQKCRPYLANLVPCIVKISKREEDTVQEILGTLMLKLCPVLGKFMREVDVKILLKSFIQNLKSESAMKRRTSASALNYICLNSRNQNRLYAWLLNILLGMVVPLTDNVPPPTLLGVLLCFRHIIPHVDFTDEGRDTMKGSFGSIPSKSSEKQEASDSVDESKLLKVYEVTMFCTKHSDHNVVNAALEALSQILQARPIYLLNVLLSPRGILPTVTSASGLAGVSFGSEVHLEALGGSASDSGLEDESQTLSESKFKESISDISLESSVRSKDSVVGDFSEISTGVSSGVQSETSSVSGEDNVEEAEEEDAEEDGLTLPSSYNDGGYVNIGEEDINRARRLTSVTSVSDIPENENEELDLAEMERMMSITSYDAKEAIERYFNIDAIACSGVPILHCVRLMCSFLLAGRAGQVLPDSRTRVSVKLLALNCLGHALTIYPEAFLARVMPDEESDATNEEDAANSEQLVRDCCLFTEHSDPQVRGMISVVAGQFIKAALCKSGGAYENWAAGISTIYSTDILPFEKVLQIFQNALEDESSISLKIACAAIKEFILHLFESDYSKYAYEMILKVLSLKDNSYWLFKVEVLELFSLLDFRLINVIETYYMEYCSQKFTGYRISSMQSRCIEAVFDYLSDEDARVRHGAARAIVCMIAHMDFTSASDKAYPQRVVQLKDIRGKINCDVKTLEVVSIYRKHKKLFDTNLAYVIKMLLKNLSYSVTKFQTHGCCQALAFIAETYPVSLSPLAWQLYPQCKISVQNVPKERSIRPLGPIRKLVFDDDMSSYPGPLSVVLSLLTSSWITLDLQAHQELLKLAVNILCGGSATFVRQIAQERKESGMTEDDETFGTVKDERWPILKDQQLNSIATKLFQHTVRLLCICMHVIDQTSPSSTSSKLPISFAGKDKDRSMSTTALPSAGSISTPVSSSPQSTPVNTSPRKFLMNKNLHKRALSDQGSIPSGEKSAQRKASDGTSPQATPESKQDTASSTSEKLGHFYTIPHMMKLYEVAKGAFKTYQVTSVSKKGEKFKLFVRGVLEAFAYQLELASFGEVGNTADEFLEYLMSCVKIDAEQAFLAVQQLLKSLFGTNVASQPEMYHLPYSTKHLVETRGDPTFSIDAPSEPLKDEKPPLEAITLFDTMIKEPCGLFEASLLAGRQLEQGSQDVFKKARSSTLSFFKKFKKIATPQKPVSKLSKEKLSSIQSYIRLFEPLVIHALKTYTMTSSLELQSQVIHLLDQLIRLRVNYSLLDADQIFIAFVLKQFEFFEAGQIANPSMIIPEMFQFLVLLSYECFQPRYSQAKSIIVMPQIIQLCDGIMACGQSPTTHAIPALKPVVQDLFISKNQIRADTAKELDTQREVAFRMLLRLTQYPEVLELMSLVLEGSKDDEEKWKRFSRQIVDVLFPQLSKLQIHLDCENHVSILNHLLDSLAPIALRPADVILKAMFASVHLTSLIDTLRWLCMILGLARILITQNNEEIMLVRVSQLGISKHNPCTLVVTQEAVEKTTDSKSENDSAEFYAKFFIHATWVACNELKRYIYSTICDSNNLLSLERLMQRLLIMFSAILKSERFRDIALAASNFTHQVNVSSSRNTEVSCSIMAISQTLKQLRQNCPSLLLHWCNLLRLLGFEDTAWWNDLFTSVKLTHSNQKWNWAFDITFNGSFLIYCSLLADFFQTRQKKDIAVLNSLLKENMTNIVKFYEEQPVQELLRTIYDDPSFSGSFLDCIFELCANVKYLEKKPLMELLENIHPNQSSSVLQFILARVSTIRSYGVARYAETIACKRLEYLQSLPANERLKLLPESELQNFSNCKENAKRFPRLVTLINKSLSRRQPEPIESKLRSLSHPLDDISVNLNDYMATKEWYHDFMKDISRISSKEQNLEDTTCVATLLISLEPDNLSELLPDSGLHLELFHKCLKLAVKSALDTKSVFLEEITQSIEISNSPELKRNQRLLQACKQYLLLQISKVNMRCITSKEPSRVSFVEKENDSVQPSENLEHRKATLDVQKFTLIQTGSIERLCATDIGWRSSVITLCRCVRDFLAPSCYWNKHWKLSKDELVILFEFSFVALRSCFIASSVKDSLIFSDLTACLDCLSLVLHSREFRNIVVQENYAQLLAHGVNDVYSLVSAATLDPGEALAGEVHLYQEHSPFVQDENLYTRSCHRVSEMIHTLRTHLGLASPKSTSIPLAVVQSLRQAIIGLARLPLVNSFVRVPPVVWKLGWQPVLEGSFQTELPPLPVEILKEKDVLREFIFRANAIGWISRAQFEETWAALLGVLSSPPVSEDSSLEDDIEATQASCLAVHCITSLVLYTTLAPVPGNPSVSRHSVIPRQKEYPFLGSSSGKRLRVIRKRIESQFKDECQMSTSQPPFSSEQFLYPVVPSLIFEKQRKQVLQRGCFMEEKLYSSNLENAQSLSTYTLGQISSSAIRTRLVSSDVQEDSDSDDAEALIIEINEEDPRKRFQELDIRSCLQFLIELFEQWLSPFVIPKTPLMLKTEAVKSLCLLSDLLLEMSHFEWILGVLLEFYQNNPSEDDITSEYIVPTVCKALAVLRVEGALAERICRIIENALKRPHVPLQISALEGGLYLLESHVPSTNMILVPILTDYLTKHIVNPVDTIQVISQRFCGFIWSTSFYIMETCSTEIQDITFTSVVVETCIALLSPNDMQIPAPVARLLFRGLEKLVVSFTIGRSSCDRLAKMAQICLQSENPDRTVTALGLLATCMYAGKEGQQNVELSGEQNLGLADSQLIMMERLGVLFTRIRKGPATEASLIASILPTMLLDFLPVQEVMNKIISEFLSSQQPHPELIAKVAFEVFDELHRQGQQDSVRNWIILSLGSFIQRTPLSMAVWSLNCFLISGTMNPWLQSLFPYILSRKGKLDIEDRRLFCMIALDFYQNQILEPEEKRMFVSTFQRKSAEIEAYKELIECCLMADSAPQE